MRAHRRRELFPTDRGLLARMVIAAVLTPLIALAALAAVVMLAPTKVAIAVGVAGAVGIFGAVRERAAATNGREVDAAEEPELHAIVERLCVMGDLPKPAIVVEAERLPNSWIVSLGRDHARLHVTRGLLERLDGNELEAVVAHELAHVAHRDSTVMTVVGGPGAVLLGGGSRTVRERRLLAAHGGRRGRARHRLADQRRKPHALALPGVRRRRRRGGADRQPGRARVRAAEGRRRRGGDAGQGPARRRGARPVPPAPGGARAALRRPAGAARPATRRCARGSPGWSAWRQGCSTRAGPEALAAYGWTGGRPGSCPSGQSTTSLRMPILPVCRRPHSPSPRRQRPSAGASRPTSRASSAILSDARGRGAGLVVLPECAIGGYLREPGPHESGAEPAARGWTPRARRSRG